MQHCIREKNETAQNVQAIAMNTEPIQTTNLSNVTNNERNDVLHSPESLLRLKDHTKQKSLLLTNTSINRSSTSHSNNKRKDETTTSATSLNSTTTNKIENDADSPQSIAIVAGRKYVMVPKTSKPSISSSVNGVQTIKSS